MELLLLIGLGVWIFTLMNRIENLESLVKNLAKPKKELSKVAQPVATKNTAQTTQPIHTKKKSTQKAAPPQTTTSSPSEFRLEDFLGRKLFSLLGVLSLVLSIGFFITWAFSNGFIGPRARIAIGILFSLIILGTGEFLRPKYPKFFDKISAAGIAGLLITTYLARNYSFEGLDYNLLTGPQSFVAYIFIVMAGILLALRYNARFLGTACIFAGIVIPLLVNSDPNPIGLFSYLSILSVAGFIISLYKKWPEVLGILFIGTLSYEIGIYNLPDIWTLMSPVIFLFFVYGISFLLGIGGLIRALRQKKQQTLEKISDVEIFEAILMTSAILGANILGNAVFENQGWNYFGFFVLAQGFGFFFLSEFVKSKKIKIFQKIFLTATLISVVFATIWEIGTDNQIMLSLFLVVESLLFSFAGKKSDEPLFSFFGKIAAGLSLISIFQINPFGASSLVTLGVITAFLYSIYPEKKWTASKPWIYISTIISCLLVLNWSFVVFSKFIGPESPNYLLFIVPTIASVALAYSALKTKNILSNIFGLSFVALISFIGLFFIQSGESLENLGILVILLVGIFSILSSFFIIDTQIITTRESKKTAVIIALSLATLLILTYGNQNLTEPLRTIFWIIWGGLLFGLGNKNAWNTFRSFGIGMFVLLIVKLYLHDVWQWDTMQRFVAFLGLGIALLSVSFLYTKKDSKK